MLPNVLVNNELKIAFLELGETASDACEARPAFGFGLASLISLLPFGHPNRVKFPAAVLTAPIHPPVPIHSLSPTISSGVTPSLLHMLRHENYTIVYRNLVVLLNVCQAPQNLKKLKQLNVVLLEPLLILCEVLCARSCLSAS